MKTVLLKMVTSKVFKDLAVRIVLAVLRKLAQRSDNTLDDQVVDVVEGALYPVEKDEHEDGI